jgi:hypothetical protein
MNIVDYCLKFKLIFNKSVSFHCLIFLQWYLEKIVTYKPNIVKHNELRYDMWCPNKRKYNSSFKRYFPKNTIWDILSWSACVLFSKKNTVWYILFCSACLTETKQKKIMNYAWFYLIDVVGKKPWENRMRPNWSSLIKIVSISVIMEYTQPWDDGKDT